MDCQPVFYLLWIIIGLTEILLQVSSQGVYHEVTDEPCDVTIQINKTVELVCSTSNTDFTHDPNICSIDQLIWRMRRLSSILNIYTSDRLSIWESVSVYGKDRSDLNFQEVSILRIENFQKDDIGRYECHVITTCDDVTAPVFFKGADLCYDDELMKGARCSLILPENHTCDKVFHNKHCDVECDTMANLYDGFDCATPVPHCQMPHCSQYFMDGVCHTMCNTASCLWDGGDCITTPLELTHDALVLDYEHVHQLAFHHSKSTMPLNHKQMSRHFSQLLGGLVRVIPVIDEGGTTASQDIWNVDVKDDKHRHLSGKVVLRLDNSLCEQRCFSKSEHLARYIKVYNSWLHNWDSDIYLPLITVLRYRRDQCTTTPKHSIHRKFQIFKTGDRLSNASSNSGRSWVNNNLLLITCFLGAGLIVILLIAVAALLICIRKEKQKHSQRKVYTSEVAKTWLFGVDV